MCRSSISTPSCRAELRAMLSDQGGRVSKKVSDEVISTLSLKKPYQRQGLWIPQRHNDQSSPIIPNSCNKLRNKL